MTSGNGISARVASSHPRPNVGLGLSVARTASSLHLANYAPISQGLLGPSDSTGFSWDQGLPPPGLQTIGRTVVNLNGRASVTSWLTLQATLGFDELLQREQQLTSPLVNSTGKRRGGDHTLRFMATVPDRRWRGNPIQLDRWVRTPQESREEFTLDVPAEFLTL